MRVLVIPDVHLKPWIFDRAEGIMAGNKIEQAVFVGDLVDDWGCQRDINLYEETLNRALEFVKNHPNTLWCYGNHDLAYIWDHYDHPGFSEDSYGIVRTFFNELEAVLESPENLGVIHLKDNVLFSHAGLVKYFVDDYLVEKEDIDSIVSVINEMSDYELWDDSSPIWVRPQECNGYDDMYPKDYMQVVGHTPVRAILEQGNLLTTDTFSTYSNGKEYGNSSFCWVDTKTKEWEVVS